MKTDLETLKSLLSGATDQDLGRLLEILLEEFSAERSCLWVESSDKFLYRGDPGLAKTHPFSRQVVLAAMRARVGLVSFDVSEDERIQPTESITAGQIRSCLCAPARDSDGRVVAVIYFDDKTTRGLFSQQQLDFLIELMAHFPGASPQN